MDGGHFAERFQLFIILALGEQVVLSGGAAADASLDVLRVLALTTAFAVTAATMTALRRSTMCAGATAAASSSRARRLDARYTRTGEHLAAYVGA